MKIGFFGIKEQEKKDYFIKNLPGQSLEFIDQSFSEENPPKQTDFEVISIFVECTLSRKIIDLFPNLKFIAVRSTGVDNVDLNYAREKKF